MVRSHLPCQPDSTCRHWRFGDGPSYQVALAATLSPGALSLTCCRESSGGEGGRRGGGGGVLRLGAGAWCKALHPVHPPHPVLPTVSRSRSRSPSLPLHLHLPFPFPPPRPLPPYLSLPPAPTHTIGCPILDSCAGTTMGTVPGTAARGWLTIGMPSCMDASSTPSWLAHLSHTTQPDHTNRPFVAPLPLPQLTPPLSSMSRALPRLPACSRCHWQLRGRVGERRGRE